MKTTQLLYILLTVALLCSCDGNRLNPGNNKKPSGTGADSYPESVLKWGLKDLAQALDLTVGAEFTYSEYSNDDSLKVILKRDFAATTFGNEMKHDNIVGKDGTIGFSRADIMAGWAADCRLELFGHTLGWHSQQQCDYLDPLIAGAPNDEAAAALVRQSYKKWVEAMVSHFDVYGWDVVNEVFTSEGEWRTSAVSDGNSYHKFLWGAYYEGGTKAFVDSAFRFARETLERSGKTADLYINDYSLEWSNAKLEALCKYAESNPDVTGVGTQMHINANVNRDNVRSMLQRMVRTGKKVRISELDVTADTVDQGETIVYIFDQYLKIVPKEQRGGITFWGVSDKNSWLGAAKEPLLYDKNYKRKDAYLKLHAYLLEASGLDMK